MIATHINIKDWKEGRKMKKRENWGFFQGMEHGQEKRLEAMQTGRQESRNRQSEGVGGLAMLATRSTKETGIDVMRSNQKLEGEDT
jgi:hypothetical protein